MSLATGIQFGLGAPTPCREVIFVPKRPRLGYVVSELFRSCITSRDIDLSEARRTLNERANAVGWRRFVSTHLARRSRSPSTRVTSELVRVSSPNRADIRGKEPLARKRWSRFCVPSAAAENTT